MNHIHRYPRNESGRDFAVGDVHGHFTRLANALASVGFDTGKDRLFAVGDLVDRGPECHHAVRWLQQPWFHSVRGNHEDIAIRYAKGNPVDRSIYSRNGGDWFMAMPVDQQRLFADAFNKMPIAIEVDTPDGLVGLVHADCPFPDWRQLREALENPPKQSFISSVEDQCMWSRGRTESVNRDGVGGIRAVVVGHTPLERPAVLGNVYHIDTGGWLQDGRFTLLDLATLKAVDGTGGALEWAA